MTCVLRGTWLGNHISQHAGFNFLCQEQLGNAKTLSASARSVPVDNHLVHRQNSLPDFRSAKTHFDLVKTRQPVDCRPDRPDDRWVNLLAQRREAAPCLNRSPQG